jgi:hypothetical protein
MQDAALYQYLLGLQSPRTVHRVGVWAEDPKDAAWVRPDCDAFTCRRKTMVGCGARIEQAHLKPARSREIV